MLLRWISTGYLLDPFDEFMVKESGHITKGVLESDYTDEYWERRYTVGAVMSQCLMLMLPSFGTVLRLHLRHECLAGNLHRLSLPGYLPLDLVLIACQVGRVFQPFFCHGNRRSCWLGNTSM